MHQASLYQRANDVQRHDAEQVLREYASVLQWRLDGRDALLDVGCGSGDVLMDFVYPLLPETYASLVGTDISTKMVSYARKCYADHARVQFRDLDIATAALPASLCEQFDHVTSFYCLHWIQNQRQALENIFRLLRPENGDCLLVFLAANPVYDVYKTLAGLPKWSAYMADVEQFISPLHHSQDPCKEFSQLLHEVGFVDYSVEIRNKVFVYEGLDNLKNNVRAICPFLERMPKRLHEDFLEDFVATVASMRLREDDTATAADYKFISPYKLVVAYARKCAGFAGGVRPAVREEKGPN